MNKYIINYLIILIPFACIFTSSISQAKSDVESTATYGLDYVVLNYAEFCSDGAHELPGHGPLCEEASPIVRSGSDALDYAVLNYADFCSDGGYELPGHGSLCEEAS